jgi:hypothetical protein
MSSIAIGGLGSFFKTVALPGEAPQAVHQAVTKMRPKPPIAMLDIPLFFRLFGKF